MGAGSVEVEDRRGSGSEWTRASPFGHVAITFIERRDVQEVIDKEACISCRDSGLDLGGEVLYS